MGVYNVLDGKSGNSTSHLLVGDSNVALVSRPCNSLLNLDRLINPELNNLEQ